MVAEVDGQSDTIDASQITAHFKYANILTYYCWADKGGWSSITSNNGTWRTAKGAVSAAAGPRALSPAHWGSWDSLIQIMTNRY